MRFLRHQAVGALAWIVVAALSLVQGPRHCRAAGWINSKEFPPFDVWAEFPLDGWQGLLGELAQLQLDLTQDLRVPQTRQWIEVFLFRDQQSYSRYLREHLPDVPYRRALYVKSQGQGRVYAYRSRELATDLRHECTHALLHAVLPVVPLWLDEGLAEYFEVPANERSYDNPHLSSLRWNLLLGTVAKLEALEKKSDLAEMSRGDYRHAWAWIHYMLHGSEQARQELIGFLRDIGAGALPGLLSQRLRRRLPATEKRVTAHIKGWKRERWFGGFR